MQDNCPLRVKCIGVNGPSMLIICSGCSIDVDQPNVLVLLLCLNLFFKLIKRAFSINRKFQQLNFKGKPVVRSTFESCTFLLDSLLS